MPARLPSKVTTALVGLVLAAGAGSCTSGPGSPAPGASLSLDDDVATAASSAGPAAGEWFTDRADAVGEKALAILKASPDEDLEKGAADIQKDIETARKTSS